MNCRPAHVPTLRSSSVGTILRGALIAAALLLGPAAAAPLAAQEPAPLAPLEFTDNPGDLDGWKLERSATSGLVLRHGEPPTEAARTMPPVGLADTAGQVRAGSSASMQWLIELP